ncbi:uncharacterized protein LOC120631751 [Pararge aegeria]|nr:uncharacterized protein LOC120631751 [Pararge aegeria]
MSVKLLLMVLTVLSSGIKVNSLNILGVFPFPAKTHFFVFAPYLKELADRGHNVTVISYYPRTEPIPNYHDIGLNKALQYLTPSHPISTSIFVSYLSLTLVHMIGGPVACKLLVEDENVQDLLESRPLFDLVVVEQFNSDCALGLAHKFEAPVIGITSHMLLPWHYRRFGVPYNPSYVMYDFLKGGTKPTFFERIKRTILYQHINFIHEYITHTLEQNIIEEHIGEVPPLGELAKDIKLVLVYQNMMLTGSTIAPPNIIEVGGYHVAKPKPLPNDLRKFIEESEHGVIYISFGTILNAASMPKDKLQHIIEGLAELPQRVIWRWNKKFLPGNPKNIFISKWLPQNDILAHPNVLAFFSHCGLLGTTEAMYHGVPIVGLPIYGDQSTNAAAIEESGLGVQTSLDLISKEYILEKFLKVLDPAFREKVKYLSRAWHDRPLKAMDSAIHWTEFAAKYRNFTFRSPAADVPLYQYLCLDVISALIMIFAMSILLFKYVVWAVAKKIFGTFISRGRIRPKKKVTMNCHTKIIALLFIIFNTVNGLNILTIFPYHGKSHFFVFKVYIQELVRRGHNVTVISHFPEANPGKNYHDISLAGSIKILEDDQSFHRSLLTVLEVGLFLSNTGKENCEVMLGNKAVRDVIDRKQKFDVIVIEQFNSDCGLGIAYKLRAPVVGITSHILMPWHYNRFGIPSNPSFVPFHFLEGGTRPTFFQRIERIVLDVYFKTLFYFISQRNNQNELAKYYDDIPPLEDLAREIKFLLLYHNFVLTGSRLFPANVKEVGGYHVREAKPLSGDLLKFFEESEHGVIYVSFGSVVKSSTMPADKVKDVLNVMSQLPQRFIWKWETKAMLMDKNKLYISEWLPQIDILGHPKTLAFWSHSGMGSTIEAIHYGVPMVAMPVIGDQPANAAAVEESGLGVQLQMRDLNKENLLAAFKKVLDPKFRENVKLVSKAWHDRPISPLESAVYWTEFAARYPNLNFTAAAAKVPCYQYYNLDVIAVFIVLFLIVIYGSKRILLLCCRKAPTQEQSIRNKSKKRSKRE